MAVVIETTMGCLTVDLFVKERPITCTNFIKLCKMKYYNFCLFHSVQNNFIAQTGDPTGTGNGGESVFGMIHGEKAKYYEAEAMPKIKHSRAGLVSMVNCGNNMLGSQFFFTLGEDLHSLDGEHCVFGEVADGLEILIQLNEVICDEEHHPFRDIRITHTVILEDPFDDPPNLTFPDHSPEPTKERLMNGRIAPDEEVDDTKGKSLEEVEEMVQKREAQARATILEIVGDIPDADIAPPENILFVCKLNPVTTDEDLEIIFGRFGTIKSCEVIRDKTTGDSLQYAFIEFEDKKACENAYFKMDNVLIDDRRIHVDFSQSVAKMRWRGKGKGVDYFPDAKQKDSQQRISKDGDVGKFEQRERKRRRSRSRSPARHKWRNQDERNSESWEKYQDRKDKDRETSGRSYKKGRDSSDGRIRNYEDKAKGHDSRGQRSERNREGRDWNNDHNYKWENRMRYEGREHHHHGRSHGFERQMDAEGSKGRDRRNRNMERSERKDGDTEERHRSSKESSSKSDKRSEDTERLSLRNDKTQKDDSDGKIIRGETSKYDEGKVDKKYSTKQKRSQDKLNKHDLDSNKYGPDMSSDNEETTTSHNKKRRFEEDKDRVASTDSSRKGNQSSRSDESRSHHYGKCASDDQASSRISGRDDVSKDRAAEQRNNIDPIDSDGSGQSVKHGLKYGCDKRKLKKNSDKKASKRNSGDGSRRSWSSEKIKKDHVSRGRKAVQKQKRYSSSSSCCSNSSCSCGSSCCSSSSDSDDSDCESKSDLSETCSSSSTSPERKIKAKKRKNKKKLLLEVKKNRNRRTGHKKRQRRSSESSVNSLDDDTKGKRKHRRRKMDDSSSSEQKSQNAGHSRGRKVKKRRKKSQKRKSVSSESSSEESSSSSESYVQRKSCGAKRKKLKKGVVGKKVKTKRNKSIKHKGKKGNSLMASKKKRKRNDSFSSESSDTSAESESGSSREEHKHRKELAVKGKGAENLRGR